MSEPVTPADGPVIDVGSWVRRPGWPEWGVGQVIARGGGTVWVEYYDRVREVSRDCLAVDQERATVTRSSRSRSPLV